MSATLNWNNQPKLQWFHGKRLGIVNLTFFLAVYHLLKFPPYNDLLPDGKSESQISIVDISRCNADAVKF